MANERQVADDSIYNDCGGKIEVREFSFTVGSDRQSKHIFYLFRHIAILR
jgi:hypothetical protein